jgi:lipoprotein-anchoring transpeptidase ErfK/SrfK
MGCTAASSPHASASGPIRSPAYPAVDDVGGDGEVRRGMLTRGAGRVVALTAAAGLLGGCAVDAADSGDDAGRAAASAPEAVPEPPDDPEPDDDEPDPAGSVVATAVVEVVEVFAAPTDDSDPIHRLEHPTQVGAPRVFLVDDRPGDGWLEVLLPVRPNGSTGWIQEADVELARNPYAIAVDLSAFALTVRRDDEVVLSADIGFGAEDTPTPGGRYYLTELLQPPDPTGVYGPFAFGLSGFSDVHLDFAGGDGVIGIHGTNEPDSIGRTVSNGCIRVDNDVITEMASFLPLGTPVTISG